MPTKPRPSAKNVSDDFDKFTDFMRKLVQVPHSEIKARLDAEKKVKQKPPVSRASDSSSKS